MLKKWLKKYRFNNLVLSQYFDIIETLINELIGIYFAKVYRVNTGMPIWDPSICYNNTHPRFNVQLELFLHLK